jgi:hypothetical protein
VREYCRRGVGISRWSSALIRKVHSPFEEMWVLGPRFLLLHGLLLGVVIVIELLDLRGSNLVFYFPPFACICRIHASSQVVKFYSDRRDEHQKLDDLFSGISGARLARRAQGAEILVKPCQTLLMFSGPGLGFRHRSRSGNPQTLAFDERKSFSH